MAEQIYTIPINEAFEARNGCPLCQLKKKLEDQSLHYILGAAMMDPDVRIHTNRLGFCQSHFRRLLSMGNRLSLALILESHLAAVAELLPELPAKPSRLGKLKKYDGDSPAGAMAAQAASCFVCSRVAEAEQKYVSNVVYIWKRDPAFRETFQAQPYFCLDHAAALLSCAQRELNETLYLEFSQNLIRLERDALAALRTDTTGFCRSFDHENAGKPLTDGQRLAVEQAAAFLAGDGTLDP